MAREQINYDRGVMKSIHAKTGVEVYMYLDEPGVYLNAYGTQVTEKLAGEAGFNIVQLRAARVRRERMADAKEQIEAELAIQGPKRVIVKTRAGFAIIGSGFGRHNIEDPDGVVLNKKALTKEEAEVWFDQIAPEGVMAEPAEPAEPTKVAKSAPPSSGMGLQTKSAAA